MKRFITISLFMVLVLPYAITKKPKEKIPPRMKYKKTHYVRGRTTMVHLFEWKWKDIAAECERFLGPKGYGGVQVSPPNENLMVRLQKRPWWERYQPISYRLITRSGNEKQFANMVRRCNNVGVRIYVDAVINHMAAQSDEYYGTGGSKVNFGDWVYPSVPYYSYNFNWPHCIISKEDYKCCPERVRNCQLDGLRDLNLGTEHVRDVLVKYLNHLIRLGVAGFRIDSAKHMWPFDLKIIYSRLHSLSTKHGFPSGARPFIYQEVIDFGGEAISSDEYTAMGAVTEFRYGMEVSRAFQRFNVLSWLHNLGTSWGFVPSHSAITFIDNHDNQRGYCPGCNILTYKKPKNYIGAVAFMLAYSYGNPRIMSSFKFENPDVGPPMDENQRILSPSIKRDGSCGNGWVCEHRWPQIYSMVAFRKVAANNRVNDWWDNGSNQIAFCRGAVAFVAFNNDLIDFDETLQVCVPPGRYCDVITGVIKRRNCTGKLVTVNKDGRARISIRAHAKDMVLAIHVGKQSKL
ncbi:unnamed protein product [Arctia plantaginis]|uniref:Alpha-amylase n=1 Tax=Arctia plantaginis TaxID=874455 RepID=A0A8S1BLX4_ARCPL|nr:unnamed protein product [Arctia plantaginis]